MPQLAKPGRPLAAALGCFLLTALTLGAYLFRVPGFHYDEAWIADLGARIAFEPAFWPLHGMNNYTVPVMSYFLAALFRLAGYPSLELARLGYFGLNLLAFAGFYAWVARVRPRAAAAFGLLWATLPLSVFNHRLFLEVTTGYAVCSALILWGLTLAFAGERPRPAFLALAVLGAWLGIASHILFLSVVLGLLWATWRQRPELLAEPPVRAAISAVFAPIVLLMLAVSCSPLGWGARAKALVAAVAVGLVLVGIWRRWWESGWTRPLVRGAGGVITVAAAAGWFFLFLFELSGLWPTSQTTGHLLYAGLLPGLLTSALLVAQIRAGRREPLAAFLLELWQVVTAITILTIYKPTSARYYELPLLGLLLLAAAAWRPDRFTRVLPLLALLHVGALAYGYYGFTVNEGAPLATYRMLWVKDSARDYRPVVRAYRLLRAEGSLCAQDEIGVDDGRADFVLGVYRSFARRRGEESSCPLGRRSERFWVGAAAPEAGAKPVWAHGARPAGLGDFDVFRRP